MTERTLYVVTRRDLLPAVRVVMSLHVVADFVHHSMTFDCLAHPINNEEWGDFGPPIVFMTVRNRERLEKLVAKYNTFTYSDPDLNDGIDAICIYEEFWNDNWARMAQLGEAPDNE